MREVRCPACSTLNRFKRYSVSRIPWCGKCKAALPEPRYYALARQLYVRRHWAIYILVIGSPLVFFAVAGSGNYSPPQPPAKQQAVAESCTPQPRPAQGEFYGRDDHLLRLAPFKVKTASGFDYFVKLESTEDSSNRLWFFAHGGSDLETDVPLGTYELRYAFGKQWCGMKELFGRETIAKKGRTLLVFRREYDGYSGQVVTLIAQRGGNFPTSYIAANEF